MSPKTSNFAIAASATLTAAVAGYFVYQNYAEAESREPRARVFETKEDVAKELCAFVAEQAQEAIQKRGVFHLSVAGGSLLDLLSGLKDHKDSVDFSKVVLSFANHKCVPLMDSEKSNLAKCKSKFADAAGITRIVAPTRTPDENNSDGSKEAAFYANALVTANVPHKGKYPVLDLILLGLGADGHVGSCHPKSVAALETVKGVSGSPKIGEPASITLTIESMNAARQTCVIVCGGSNGKKEAVKRAMTRPAEEPRGTCPAQSLSGPLFFIDAEAAALL